MTWYEPDDDERREAIERRKLRRATQCICDPGHTMPGQCPGPLNCPHAGDDEDEAAGEAPDQEIN